MQLPGEQDLCIQRVSVATFPVLLFFFKSRFSFAGVSLLLNIFFYIYIYIHIGIVSAEIHTAFLWFVVPDIEVMSYFLKRTECISWIKYTLVIHSNFLALWWWGRVLRLPFHLHHPECVAAFSSPLHTSACHHIHVNYSFPSSLWTYSERWR